MNTLIKSTKILYRDEVAEKRLALQIEEEFEKTQAAVDAFNAIGLKPLQPEELNYFLQGGHTWVENRWKEEQEAPKGWIKEKYLANLEQPDFSKAVEASSKVNILNPELFYLQGTTILVSEEIREKVINQFTIYLTDEEQLKADKLQAAIEFMDELGLIQRNPIDPLAIAPVQLAETGYRLSRFSEDEGRFNLDPHKLKRFLSGLTSPDLKVFGGQQNNASTPKRKADILRKISKEKYA